NYTFPSLTAGTYTVSIQLPSGFWGASAQGLSYQIALADGQSFVNLNFSLLPKTQALVRNLYERVLVRDADQAGLNAWVNNLTSHSMTGGQVFVGFLASPEFNQLVQPLALTEGAFFPNQPLDAGLLRSSIQNERVGITPDANVLNFLYSQQ